MKEKDCPFCTDAGIRERIIAENLLVKAFLTNIPIVPGHTLIVPTRHVATYSQLTRAQKGSIFEMMGLIKRSLQVSFQAEGFNIAWNEGEVAGQSVPHFHLHVIPRKAGDSGIYQYEPRDFIYRPGSREESPKEELIAVTKLIQSNLEEDE